MHVIRNPEQLIETAECGNFLVTSVAGVCESVNIPGLRGRVTRVAHPIVNLVGQAQLMEETAENAIAQAIEVFRSRAMPFAWVLGPRSEPTDLHKRLRARGLFPSGSVDAMARRLDTAVVAPQVGLQIGRATEDQLAGVSACIADAYRIPLLVADTVLAISLARQELEPRVYCALDEEQRPISSLITCLMPNGWAAFYRAGGTLPAWRGRGLFSALLAYALAETRRQGASVVVLQSNPRTSGGILRLSGFERLCQLDTFVYAARPAHRERQST